MVKMTDKEFIERAKQQLKDGNHLQDYTIGRLIDIIDGQNKVLKMYADPKNWGYYDESGCEKGIGNQEDACFIGPEPAREVLKNVNG